MIQKKRTKKEKKKKKKRKKKEKKYKNSTLHPCIFLLLKILTAFSQGKPEGLAFISSRFTYFGFSLGLHFQVKYIFHLC